MATRRFHMQNATSNSSRGGRRGAGAWRLDIDNAYTGESRAGLGFSKGSSTDHAGGTATESVASPAVAVPAEPAALSYDERVADVDAKLASFLAEINSLPSADASSETHKDPVEDSLPPSKDVARAVEETPSYYGSLEEGKSTILFVKSKEILAPTLQPDATSSGEDHGKGLQPQGVDKTEAETMQEPVTVWQHCLDEGTQFYYFWNTVTNEVTWEIPDEYSEYLLKKKLYDEWFSRSSSSSRAAEAEVPPVAPSAQHSAQQAAEIPGPATLQAPAKTDEGAPGGSRAGAAAAGNKSSAAVSLVPRHSGGSAVKQKTGLVVYAGSDSGSDDDEEEAGAAAVQSCGSGTVDDSQSAEPRETVAPEAVAADRADLPRSPDDRGCQRSADAVSVEAAAVDDVRLQLAAATESKLGLAAPECDSRSAMDTSHSVTATAMTGDPEQGCDGDPQRLPDAALLAPVYGPDAALPAPVYGPDATASAMAGQGTGTSVITGAVGTAQYDGADASTAHAWLASHDAAAAAAAAEQRGTTTCPASEHLIHWLPGPVKPDVPFSAEPVRHVWLADASGGSESVMAASSQETAAHSVTGSIVEAETRDTSSAQVSTDRVTRPLLFKSYEDVENIAQPVGPDEPLVFRPLPPADDGRMEQSDGSIEKRGRHSRKRRSSAVVAEDGSVARGNSDTSAVAASRSKKRLRQDRDGPSEASDLLPAAVPEVSKPEVTAVPQHVPTPGGSRLDEKQQRSKEEEETEGDLTALSSKVLEKLVFLDVSCDHLTRLQLLLIQTKVRLDDWQAGGLDRNYLLERLREADAAIHEYEQYAVPPGWSCHWDSTYKRYFYLNEVTEEVQWEYPEDGLEEMMNCAAAAAMHQGSASRKGKPPPVSALPMGSTSNTVRMMSARGLHSALDEEDTSRTGKCLLVAKLARSGKDDAAEQQWPAASSHVSGGSKSSREASASRRRPSRGRVRTRRSSTESDSDSDDGERSGSATVANAESVSAKPSPWQGLATTSAADVICVAPQQATQRLEHTGGDGSAPPLPSYFPPPPPPPPPGQPPSPQPPTSAAVPESQHTSSPPLRAQSQSATESPVGEHDPGALSDERTAAALMGDGTAGTERTRSSKAASAGRSVAGCSPVAAASAAAADGAWPTTDVRFQGDLESCYDSFMAEVSGMGIAADEGTLLTTTAGSTGGGTATVSSAGARQAKVASAAPDAAVDSDGVDVVVRGAVGQGTAIADAQPGVIYGAPVSFYAAAATVPHSDAAGLWADSAMAAYYDELGRGSAKAHAVGGAGTFAVDSATAVVPSEAHVLHRPEAAAGTSTAAVVASGATAAVASSGEKKKKDKDKSKKASGKQQQSSKKSSLPTLVHKWQQVHETVTLEMQKEKRLLDKLRREAL